MSALYKILDMIGALQETVFAICDPLRENPALRANIEFEFEAILSVEVVSQLNSDYCTSVSQGACTVSC